MKRLKVVIAAFCLPLCLCVLLVACGKDETVIPLNFEFEEESLPALGALGEEFSGTLVETVFPDEEPVYDEEGNEIPSVNPIVYAYEKVENSGSTVGKYVELLTAPEYGFGIVNAAGKLVSPPDYTQEEGFVVLSRSNVHTKKMLRFTILWEPDTCTINLYRVDGLAASTDPNEPVREISSTGELYAEGTLDEGSYSNTGSGGSGGAMTAEDVVTFFESLSPSVLGLEGESMDAYHIYFFEGKVLVNDDICSGVRIYTTSYPEESNAFVGTYLVGASSKRIYQHDIETDSMLEWTR